MDFRRLTVFPKTGKDDIDNVHSRDDNVPTRALKRKFVGATGPLDLELPRVLAPTKNTKNMHKIYAPIQDDPGRFYQCIQIVDPDGKRPFCLAQERSSKANEYPYRIVMIRRSAERAVVGICKPNPNLLNIISVFRFEGSIFTIFDRPGLPLSEIIVSHSPQLGVVELKTISKETLHGLNSLSQAGLSLPSIELEDVTVSAYDGRVKVEFDRAAYQGPEVNSQATPFKVFLENVMLHHPDRSRLENKDDVCAFIQCAGSMAYQELQIVDFLLDALPARSLIPFVMNAQVSVLPVEYIIEAQISDLKETGPVPHFDGESAV